MFDWSQNKQRNANITVIMKNKILFVKQIWVYKFRNGCWHMMNRVQSLNWSENMHDNCQMFNNSPAWLCINIRTGEKRKSLSMLKVRKSQKDFFLSSNAPNNQQNNFMISALLLGSMIFIIQTWCVFIFLLF